MQFAMPPRVRLYDPADLPALYRIDQACFPRGIAYSKASLCWFLSLSGSICLVSELRGVLAGFVIARAQAARAHLITLDVLAPYRRRCIGSVLLHAVESDLAAQHVRVVELETATDNHAAVAFWQKHGYRTLDILERYYLGRIDAYSMSKPLPARREP